MKLFPFIIALFFLGGSPDLRAQTTEEQGPSSSMPEQWQMTLDVIKSKAQSLMVENNGLQAQYQQLMGQEQELQQAISDQQDKNTQVENFLKDRHGQTDQQLRTEELTQIIKAKDQQVRGIDEQLENLQRKKSNLDNSIQSLKYTISDIELHQQTPKQEVKPPQNIVQPLVDEQLVQLRKQLEDESRQEVLLDNQLEGFKIGDKTQNLNVDAIDSENRQLQARLELLELQKLRYEKESSDVQLSQATARMYDKLKMRKDELEAKIYAYESRMEGLRQSSMIALSWPLRKKKLVHEMVQVDARNNQMRGQVKVLREDIGVLKDQVTALERRVNAVQNKDVTFNAVP